MDVLKNISNGKYKCNGKDINGGAFSKIYDAELVSKKGSSNNGKKNKFIVKLHKNKYKREAINEIETLIKLKKNKKKFKEHLKQHIDIKTPEIIKSKLVVLKDYYYDNDIVCAVFKKYEMPLDGFNIKYNKMFKETLPPSLIKKIYNSLFLGLYELHFSKLIHCDIKPNNILLSLTKYNTVDELLKSVSNKKLKKDDMHKFIDIKIIDFNKTQKFKSICKSTSIQTLYYTPPEIILGNRNYNYSVDVWAMMNIVYELITSLFLFDVCNENIYNGLNYKNYEDSDSDSDMSSYDGSDENSANSEYSNTHTNSDSYEDETTINLALLHLYNYQLGKNNIIKGDYIDKYYSYGRLMGTVDIDYVRQIKSQKDIDNKDIELVNKFIELYEKIYLYDIDKRITSEDIVKNYLFLKI